MKNLNILPITSTEDEVKQAIAELSAPAPLRIAKLLGVVHPKDNKLGNIHAIFDHATLPEIIEAYNELQYVRAGNMKVFRDFFKFSIQAIKDAFPLIKYVVKALEDGQITKDEIESFIDQLKSKK